MKHLTLLSSIVLAGSAMLAGCASHPSTTTTTYSSIDTPVSGDYGTIDTIQVTHTEGGSKSGAGAVVGGLVGGLLGNQVGSGSGRTAATVAGAVGGAVVGNNVESNRSAPHDTYSISVRMDNGDYRTIVQDSIVDLRPGNRVRIVDGRAYRY
ncbi:MAG: glycine zipper 2TM domain-containing protein [Pseudomonadota bacterium]